MLLIANAPKHLSLTDRTMLMASESTSSESPSRNELAAQYLDQLPFEPYPVQEEALLAWFTAEQGVLVCAPQAWEKR